jgi:GDP-L-fucose synthase
MIKTNSTVFIAGVSGMAGSAIGRALMNKGYAELVGSYHSRPPQSYRPTGSNGVPHPEPRHVKLDLTDLQAVRAYLDELRPDCVILAAAKVGGIHANSTYPAEFIHENLAIQTNVIQAAHLAGVQRLLFLGSSCIYPKEAEQPMREEALLTGPLEPTNEPYAVAKIAGIKMCESYNRQYGRDYRSVMPTNLYGPNDNFHPENSHVAAALLRRFHEAVRAGADEVVIWGSGTPRREFLHVDDMAEACLFIMETPPDRYWQYAKPMLSHINIGSGVECTIRELAETIAHVVGFAGRVVFDTSRPDGAPRKLLDVSLLRKMGWQARISLETGLEQAYAWYLENADKIRGVAS